MTENLNARLNDNEDETGSQRCVLTLTPDAIAVLDKHTSPRKRGEFVSNLLLQYSASDKGIAQLDVDGIRLQLLGLATEHKTAEARLARAERQLAAVIAKVG